MVATGTDIYWLIGDMSLQVHAHHWPTMVGLITAEALMAASFIWLGISLLMYQNKKELKIQAKAREKADAKLEHAMKISEK